MQCNSKSGLWEIPESELPQVELALKNNPKMTVETLSQIYNITKVYDKNSNT